MFRDLSATRGGTGYGPLPISFAEIEAWSRLGGTLEPWEIDLIRELDRVWMADAARQIKQHGEERPPSAGQAEDPFRPETLPKFDRSMLREMAGGRPK